MQHRCSGLFNLSFLNCQVGQSAGVVNFDHPALWLACLCVCFVLVMGRGLRNRQISWNIVNDFCYSLGVLLITS